MELSASGHIRRIRRARADRDALLHAVLHHVRRQTGGHNRRRASIHRTVDLLRRQHRARAQQHIGHGFMHAADGFLRSRRAESDFRHRQTAVRQRLAQRHSVVRIINSNDRHEASQRQLLQKFHDTSSFLCGLTRACKRLQAVMRMKEGSLPYPLDAHELNQYHHTTFSAFRQGKMQHFAHFSRKKRADGAKGRVRSILRNSAEHGIIKSA